MTRILWRCGDSVVGSEFSGSIFGLGLSIETGLLAFGKPTGFAVEFGFILSKGIDCLREEATEEALTERAIPVVALLETGIFAELDLAGEGMGVALGDLRALEVVVEVVEAELLSAILCRGLNFDGGSPEKLIRDDGRRVEDSLGVGIAEVTMSGSKLVLCQPSLGSKGLLCSAHHVDLALLLFWTVLLTRKWRLHSACLRFPSCPHVFLPPQRYLWRLEGQREAC
jgi:hypothetical protein